MTMTRPLSAFSRLLLRSSSSNAGRPFSTSILRPARVTENPDSQRDAQKDREKINTEANEYAKSGTDASAAKQEEAAFSPNNSDPQDAKAKAGEGNDVNPLNASPANPDISQTTSEEQGGAGKKMSEGGGGRQGGGDSTGDKYGGSSV